jgi:hypothetical protein
MTGPSCESEGQRSCAAQERPDASPVPNPESPGYGNTGQSTRTKMAWKASRLMRYPLRGPR